ncbi:hypothetical protein BSNK01_31740 [Bacillaceae bacterium]
MRETKREKKDFASALLRLGERFGKEMARQREKWTLFGSSSLKVQGVDIDPGDIDVLIQTAQGVKIFHETMGDCIRKSRLKKKGIWGTGECCGCRFEYFGEPKFALAQIGPCDSPEFWKLVRKIEYNGISIPVIPLEWQVNHYLHHTFFTGGKHRGIKGLHRVAKILETMRQQQQEKRKKRKAAKH